MKKRPVKYPGAEGVVVENFKEGDRVVPTQEAYDQGIFIKQRVGTVTRTRPRDDRLIHVRLDGNKTGTSYHKKFWTRMPVEPQDDVTPREYGEVGAEDEISDGTCEACGCAEDEHGGDPKLPGSTACQNCEDCIAYEPR